MAREYIIIVIVNEIGGMYTGIGTPKRPSKLITNGTIVPIIISMDCFEKNPEFLIE